MRALLPFLCLISLLPGTASAQISFQALPAGLIYYGAASAIGDVNNDGRNDVFVPMEMCGIATGTLKIYNRWGQLLFTSEIRKGWNGRVNGSKSNDGVYYYLVEYQDFRGQEKKKKGWLELVGS